MKQFTFKRAEVLTPAFLVLLLLVLGLGIGFRWFHLGYKVYWHDEVYTTMRAAGYTRHEIDQAVFTNRLLPASALQQFLQIKPGSTLNDTVRSLAVEDPQHPPLFFLMSRGWLGLFGSSYAANRSLSALLSLLGFPLMYGLAMELFQSRRTALVAVMLLAVCPFNILFDQTARQYGLLTVLVIGSSWLLLRALRRGDRLSWVGFAIATALGLYTHPYFGLTSIGQGVYVGLRSLGMAVLRGRREEALRSLLSYVGASGLALLLYAPWLYVLLSNLGRALSTTDWSRVQVGLDYLAKLWTLSFSSLFFDLDFGFNNPWSYVVRGVFMGAIAVSLYTVCRRAAWPVWLFILTSILVPFLILALPDLISGGKRSAVSRYLISCYPGVQLAVAFWLGRGLQSGRRLGPVALGLVLTAGILSCSVSAFSDTWWSKDLSYSNGKTARYINALSRPVIVSDLGADYTNTGDLIAMSDRLAAKVQLLALNQDTPNLELFFKAYREGNNVLFFRPSIPLQERLWAQGWQLVQVVNNERLHQPSQRVAERIWRLQELEGD